MGHKKAPRRNQQSYKIRGDYDQYTQELRPVLNCSRTALQHSSRHEEEALGSVE